jgi:hypothetical protein
MKRTITIASVLVLVLAAGEAIHGGEAFLPGQTYPVIDGPYGSIAGDFNDDDRIDLATAFVSGRKIGVYTARADGSFDGPITYPSLDDSWNIVAADFDGDNQTDLAVLQHYGISIAVMDGRGDGSFAGYVEYPVDYGPLGMAAGDFNGDDRLDLAIGHQNYSQISVYYGQSGGTLGGKRIFQTTTPNYDLVTSDFNEDGILDLAFNTYNDVQLMYGQGDGSFGGLETYAINGSAVYRLTAADLDLDGHTDLIASSYHTDTINILYNTIPEPATLSLLALGGLVVLRRRPDTSSSQVRSGFLA